MCIVNLNTVRRQSKERPSAFVLGGEVVRVIYQAFVDNRDGERFDVPHQRIDVQVHRSNKFCTDRPELFFSYR